MGVDVNLVESNPWATGQPCTVSNLNAKRQLTGSVPVASDAEIDTGEIDDKVMTPKGVKRVKDAHAASGEHDERYYLKSEVDGALAGKAASVHNHDDRYYTEAELNAILDSYYTQEQVDSVLSGKAASAHTHDDLYYTRAEVVTLLAGYYTKAQVDSALAGKAASVHTHDDRYYTEGEVDAKLSAKAASVHTHTADQVSETATKKWLSGDDKTKLDGIDEGAQVNPTIHTGFLSYDGTTLSFTSYSGFTTASKVTTGDFRVNYPSASNFVFNVQSLTPGVVMPGLSKAYSTATYTRFYTKDMSGNTHSGSWEAYVTLIKV